MPRLRNTTTGVVVNVDKDTADRLGSGWVPVEEKASEPKRAATGARSASKAK